MDTKAELEQVIKELDYYKQDFEAKRIENIYLSIKICFDKLETLLKNKGTTRRVLCTRRVSKMKPPNGQWK